MALLRASATSPVPPRVMLGLMGALAVAYAALLVLDGWDAGTGSGLALVLALSAETLERQAMAAPHAEAAPGWRALKLAGLVASAALLAAKVFGLASA